MKTVVNTKKKMHRYLKRRFIRERESYYPNFIIIDARYFCWNVGKSLLLLSSK